MFCYVIPLMMRFDAAIALKYLIPIIYAFSPYSSISDVALLISILPLFHPGRRQFFAILGTYFNPRQNDGHVISVNVVKTIIGRCRNLSFSYNNICIVMSNNVVFMGWLNGRKCQFLLCHVIGCHHWQVLGLIRVISAVYWC